jgi:hypothetical protein
MLLRHKPKECTDADAKKLSLHFCGNKKQRAPWDFHPKAPGSRLLCLNLTSGFGIRVIVGSVELVICHTIAARRYNPMAASQRNCDIFVARSSRILKTPFNY